MDPLGVLRVPLGLHEGYDEEGRCKGLPEGLVGRVRFL